MRAGNHTYNPIVRLTTMYAFNLTLFSMGCVDESKATDILTEENNAGQYMKIFINDGQDHWSHSYWRYQAIPGIENGNREKDAAGVCGFIRNHDKRSVK